MTTMYDSVTAADIPEDAEAVAGYVTGKYAWSAQDWARFPDRPALQIATSAVNAGDTFDVENGDLTPAQLPGMVAKARERGIARPWVYVDLANWAEAAAQVVGVGWWVASWTGEAPAEPLELPSGVKADAVQYANPETSGGHFDLSVVFANTYPTSSSSGGDTPTEEDTMQLYATNSAGTGFVIAADLSSKRGLPDPEDAAALLATGLYKEVKLTDAVIDAIPG